METQRGNLFDLLRDDDHEDPSQLIAAVTAAGKQPQKIPSVKGSQAKLPSKPLPLQQVVKGAKNNGAQIIQTSQSQFPRRGTHGQNREFRAKGHDANTQTEEGWGGETPRGSSWYANGDVKDASLGGPRRAYDRYSNANRRPDAKGDEFRTQFTEKGSKGNSEKLEKKENRPVDDGKADKEDPQKEEEKEPEDKEMTLEEYEKIMEERRKALVSVKTEDRKVEMDKDFECMKQLSVKKENNEVFIQLGSNKDASKKKDTERQEKSRKSLNVNKFLRPVEGQNYNRSEGRGRARGTNRGQGGQTRGHFIGWPVSSDAEVPLINDPSHFPTLSVN
ncbi:uncharacterized protein LOC144571260 isoform X2 [Carex rostrata]